MAFGTSSKIFSAFIHDSVTKTGDATLASATMKAALFDNTPTPNQLVTSANSAYGAGVWAANQVTDTGSSAPAGWPTVGRPLAWSVATQLTTYAAATVKFDSDDTVSANAVTTITSAYGVLVYDDAATTVANQGICYISFGGSPQSVTLGTFTIQWHASGVLTIAL